MAEIAADRRVRRTRQLLVDALLALIVERGYEALTVQDVLDRADIGRSTFYAHFRDKDDLLAAAFSRLHTVLEGRTGAAGAAGLAELSLALFRHTDEHRPLYRAMVGRPSGAMLTRAVHEHFVALYEQGLIYRGQRLINWDPADQTALSDLEVEHEEGAQAELWSFAYPLAR